MNKLQQGKEMIIFELKKLKEENYSKIKRLLEQSNAISKEIKELENQKEKIKRERLEQKRRENEIIRQQEMREWKKKQEEQDNERSFPYSYKEFKIEEKEPARVLSQHDELIHYLELLRDGSLLSISQGSQGRLIIYSPKIFNVVINKKMKNIYYPCALSNGNFALSKDDRIIRIYSVKNENLNLIQEIKIKGKIQNIVELKNESICVSYLNKVDFYKKNYDDKYSLDFEYSLPHKDDSTYGIVKTKGNEICIVCIEDPKKSKNFAQFYNWIDRKETGRVNNLGKTYHGFRLVKLNSDLIAFYDSKEVYIVDINYKEITSVFYWPEEVESMCQIYENIIILGDGKGDIVQCKVEDKKLVPYSRKNGAHSGNGYNFTTSVVCLYDYDGHFASGGSDNIIKIW
jgi:WD40 repeat protein